MTTISIQNELQWLRQKVDNQQMKRVDKVFSENYFVLEHILTESLITITITGSTQSVYTITIDKNTGTIQCNCPDSQSFSLRFGCMCKHCCFIIIKICKWIQVFEGWNTKVFTPLEVILLEQRLNSRASLRDDRLTNEHLESRYNLLKSKDDVNILSLSSSIFDETTTFTDEDECPICYESLRIGETKCCPTCHNHIHLVCIQKWLETKTNCVLCRSDIWKQFLKENKKVKTSNYIKL